MLICMHINYNRNCSKVKVKTTFSKKKNTVREKEIGKQTKL